MLVLRPPAATKVAPRTRERTGLHLPKVRALGRPSHRSRLNDSARNAGTPPAAANIVGLNDAEGPRPAPGFVEWLMGLPTGWVTDSDELTQNQQITALGNGVLPLQAVSALSLLAA
jgi:hypothetical protein